MALLQLNNIYMDYAGNNILKDINFSVDEKDKIGIIGLNGAGKSTLIKIILGLESYSKDINTNEFGSISKKTNLKIGYLSQHPKLNENNTVFDELMSNFSKLFEIHHRIQELNFFIANDIDYDKNMEELGNLIEKYEKEDGYKIEYKVRTMLNNLNIDENTWNVLVKDLSGGQLSRLALGKILLEEPELLILDEPTNHLDLTSIEWLEKTLKEYNNALILVSHDKYFLDNVCNRIFELEAKTIKTYKGNYTDFIIQKDAYLSGAVKSYEKEQEKIKKMEEFIRRYKAGVKSKQARGREKILSRMSKMENPVVVTKKIKLKFNIKNPSVDLVLETKNLSKKFDDKNLFSNINMKIYRGDRIGIIGKNGTGKSTLLKIINNIEKATSGEFKIGEKVSIGYYDQTHQGLGLDNNILEELTYHYDITNEEARNLCGAFLFREDDVLKKIKNLSGGEKTRLAFMKIMLEKPNFLILDEPTNHLDIYSREILIEALENYEGTILTVSHDRNFLDSVVNKIYELKSESINIFDGDYENYIKEKNYTKEKNEEAIKKHEENKKNRNRVAILEKNIIKIEEEISNLEENKNLLNIEYENAGKLNDLDLILQLQEKIDLIEDKILENMNAWEDFSSELENLKNTIEKE